jgi:hypothetical protein
MLLNVSATFFNPDRGVGDQAACKQAEANGNYFGPWLAAPSE